jgi:PAS domain S-box-containing protein
MGMRAQSKNIELREAFFNNASELFTLCDKNLKIVDVNTAVLRLFRFNREDVIGKNLLQLVPDFKGSLRHKIYKEVLLTGQSFQIEDLALHPSLGNLRLRLHIFRVGDGIGISATNITDLKETIEELDQLMYRISHDLRGPLARIMGLLNVADVEVRDLKKASQFRKKMRHQAELINDILSRLSETQRIRKDEKVITAINFQTLLKKVVRSLSYVKGYSEIRFEYDINVPGKFYSDQFLLITIFANLLENAIKYSREEVESFIRVTIAPDDEDSLMITVTDNGIGIADNLQEKAFNMFFRATNQASGAGLGLYTTRHSVKRLGGIIFLESMVDVGTEVTVFIPNEKQTAERLILPQVALKTHLHQ